MGAGRWRDRVRSMTVADRAASLTGRQERAATDQRYEVPRSEDGGTAMTMELGGLHHLTAVTARAAENVAFYTQTLGLRLVKKTVNQDDVSAYHLFYGDEAGHAGTEVTFFDWAMAAPNRPGTGEVAAVALRVGDRATLDWWAARFRDLGVAHEPIAERDGRATLTFTDPEGQRLELVEDGDSQVFVVLYDVTREDEARLDRWEGSELGLHSKIRLRVQTLEGSVLAWLYVLDAYEGGLPSARYLGVMADAAEAAGAPADYVAALRTRPCHGIGP